MSTQTELNKIVKELVTTDHKLRELNEKRDALRLKFFEYAEEGVKQDVGLVKRTVTVPIQFFIVTKMEFEDFSSSRYPEWRIVEVKQEAKDVVFLLEQDPVYLPWSYTHPTTRHVVSKQIAIPSPSLDSDTFRLDQPELWGKVMKPVTTYEPDPVEIQQAIQENPDLVSVFQAHTKYKKPTQKLGPIRMEKTE